MIRLSIALTAAALALTACGSADGVASAPQPASTAGRLLLTVEKAETAAEGRRCDLAVSARNDTGVGAMNVQAAWMAQTEGFGIISDYQMLGDFAADEARTLRLSIVGAPCAAVRSVKLTRAVCAVAPLRGPPETCADRVTLDGGGIVPVER